MELMDTASMPHTAPAEPQASAPLTPYRAGIIGGGFMGSVHAHAVRVAGGTVAAVTSGSPDSARRAARELGASRAATDATELLAMDDVEVVHVCTPNHLHHPVALAALQAGKHVVCEKPLATDSELASELVVAAQDSGRIATVPFVYRFHAMVREARERVRNGSIGRVVLAHGSYLQDWMSDPAEDNWRVAADLGGASRAFGDIGSHWCDLLEFVTGDRIASVSARLVTAHATRGADHRAVDTEDIATVSFLTVGGVAGTAVISQVSPGRKNRLLLEVAGTEATLSFDQEQPERLWNGQRDASQLLVRDPDTLSAAAVPYSRLPAGHPMGYQDCFNAFVADTARAIAGDVPDGLPSFSDGLRSTHVVEAVIASAQQGSWVEVQG